MGERKVLNKYYPPDFDPSKIPKKRELKNQQMKVRMMLPMSIRCATCGTYMYKGTKFNCRKEDVVGDTYLGIMKFRFYFKCPTCASEMVMKTDPQNSDYEMEFGASRNFEPWREKDEAREAAKKQREAEEMGDAMKALENRTLDSRMEMDILAALDETKSLRARQAGLNPEEVLRALKQTAGGEERSEQQLAEEDERLIQSIVFRNSDRFVRRIEEEEEEVDEEEEREGQGTRGEQDDAAKGGAVGNGGGQEGGPRKRGRTEKEEETSKTRRKPSDVLVVREESGMEPKAAVLSGGVGKRQDQEASFEVKPVKVQFAVRSKRQEKKEGNEKQEGGEIRTKDDGGGKSISSQNGETVEASTMRPEKSAVGLLVGYRGSDESESD